MNCYHQALSLIGQGLFVSQLIILTPHITAQGAPWSPKTLPLLLMPLHLCLCPSSIVSLICPYSVISDDEEEWDFEDGQGHSEGGEAAETAWKDHWERQPELRRVPQGEREEVCGGQNLVRISTYGISAKLWFLKFFLTVDGCACLCCQFWTRGQVQTGEEHWDQETDCWRRDHKKVALWWCCVINTCLSVNRVLCAYK